MHPCLAIPVFALVSYVACLDAYSFDAEFRPLIEERNSVLQNEHPSSLENMANGRYFFDSSSKEGLYDELENPSSNAEKYVSLWSTGSDKNVQDDTKIFDSADVIQDLQDIQENTPGFSSLGRGDYFSREHFRPSKRSLEGLNKENEKYLMNSEDRDKSKRSGHSLSIVNPLDVLRQRMLLDMARQRMAKNEAQIQINDSILRKLGKRSHSLSSSPFARRGKQSSGENSAQRTRRQRRDYISGKQVPAFEEFEV